MDDLVLYAASALVLLIGLHRFVAARRVRITPPMRHAYGFTHFMSAALATLAPATVGAVRQQLPLTGLAELIGDLLRCAGACELGLLALTLVPQRGPAARRAVRTHHAVAVGVIVTAVCLYLAARLRTVGGELLAPGPHRWMLAGYDALVTLYTAACVGLLALRLDARTRSTAPGPTRSALRLITWSTAAGLLWSAWGVDDVLGAARTGFQTGGEDTASTLLGGVCVSLILAGACRAGWGRGWAALTGWIAAYRRYRALEPLWAAMHSSFPEVVLLPVVRPLPPLDIRLALYRRVIEIHDARLLLDRHLDADGAERVREAFRHDGSRPVQADATLEAAMLATALRHVGADTVLPARSESCWQRPETAPGELDAEADWLGQVAQAFAYSPDVTRIRTQELTMRAGSEGRTRHTAAPGLQESTPPMP